jgi:hypothetical protein
MLSPGVGVVIGWGWVVGRLAGMDFGIGPRGAAAVFCGNCAQRLIAKTIRAG